MSTPTHDKPSTTVAITLVENSAAGVTTIAQQPLESRAFPTGATTALDETAASSVTTSTTKPASRVYEETPPLVPAEPAATAAPSAVGPAEPTVAAAPPAAPADAAESAAMPAEPESTSAESTAAAQNDVIAEPAGAVAFSRREGGGGGAIEDTPTRSRPLKRPIPTPRYVVQYTLCTISTYIALM